MTNGSDDDVPGSPIFPHSDEADETVRYVRPPSKPGGKEVPLRDDFADEEEDD